MLLRLPSLTFICCLTRTWSLQDAKSSVYLLHPSACTHITNGTLTYSKQMAHRTSRTGTPIVETKYMVRKQRSNYFNPKTDTILLQVVSNPGKTFSVLEPKTPGGCKNGSGILSTVRESAKQKKCILATSGGFFNLVTGECYGNIFSDGNLVQNSKGVQSVHFGITKDGYIFVGYLSEHDLLRHGFKQLIGGLLWIIRDGKSYIDESIQRECPYIADTGDLRVYPKVKSARLIVGHDKFGRILIYQNNGKTMYFGLDVYETVPILLDLGFVNAVNLDSGSSTTVIINNTVVNHPTHPCKDNKFSCERAVSTILCVSDPDDQGPQHSVPSGLSTVKPGCLKQNKTIRSKRQPNGQSIRAEILNHEQCFDTIPEISRFMDPWVKVVFSMFVVSLAFNIIIILLLFRKCI